MRVNVAELAKAHGLRDEFDALQRLRRGKGITAADELVHLTDSLKREVLGIEQDTDERLRAGLQELRALIKAAPSRERKLLELCFNIDLVYGPFNWMDRAENFASANADMGSSRNVRHHADLALLQLLMRTRPAAEVDPEPPAPEPPVHPAHMTTRTVGTFFAEDYVRNSEGFAESWQHARTVDMCGFGHNRMAVTYSAELGRISKAGGPVRVLLQDPDGNAVLDANRRSSTPKASADAVRHQHRSGIVTFSAIREAVGAPPEALQLRMYDILPPFTAYFFDPHAECAHAYIWFWSWRQPSSWRPGFRIDRASDPLWFGRFHDQFEMLWNDVDTHEVPNDVSPT